MFHAQQVSLDVLIRGNFEISDQAYRDLSKMSEMVEELVAEIHEDISQRSNQGQVRDALSELSILESTMARVARHIQLDDRFRHDQTLVQTSRDILMDILNAIRRVDSILRSIMNETNNAQGI